MIWTAVMYITVFFFHYEVRVSSRELEIAAL